MSIWQGTQAGLVLKGEWNANTNSPALSNNGGGGVVNDLYIVSVAGTTSLDGVASWAVGDYVINNGTVWQKIPAGAKVTSVAGKVGVVTLVKADMTDFNEALYAHLAGVETISGVKTFSAMPTIPTPPVADTDPSSKKYVNDQDALRDTAIALKATDTAVLHKTGIESASGAKTFADVLKAGDVSGGHYTEFEQGSGVMRANGNARLWKDLYISAYSLASSGGSAPTLDTLFGAGTIKGLGFTGAGATAQELSGTMEMDHDYAEGTDISLHVHWMPVDANAGAVKWQLEYTIKAPNGVYSNPVTINVVANVAGVAWTHQISAFPTVSGAGLTIGSVIFFRLFRNPADASDTYGSHAILAQMGLHYQSDTIGSRAIMTK